MEENAQLRAEKMILGTTTSSTVMTSAVMTTNNQIQASILANSNSYLVSGESLNSNYSKSFNEDMSLYATVKNKNQISNKKFSSNNFNNLADFLKMDDFNTQSDLSTNSLLDECASLKSSIKKYPNFYDEK
jgi:hypothetical protein